VVNESIVAHNDLILVTGSNGFIGSRVLGTLLREGYKNLRCFVRPSSDLTKMKKILTISDGSDIEVFKGNLLSRDDCEKAVAGVSLIYHLAAGRGEKSYPDAYLNSVVTTRNLIDAALRDNKIKRFLCVSSFSVYTTIRKKRRKLIDESWEVEAKPALRGEAYCYAKVKQEEMVVNYGILRNLPYVIVRPGAVYGPGNKGITGRVGISTFGIFLHMGGSNRIPLSYVDNCADAIVLAGLKKGLDGEIFNIFDDDPPTSRQFLKMYKENVRRFVSIYIPHSVSYMLCALWERYSKWSNGQLPPVFNRRRWYAEWKDNRYSNKKIKEIVGWRQNVSFLNACRQYFESERKSGWNR